VTNFVSSSIADKLNTTSRNDKIRDTASFSTRANGGKKKFYGQTISDIKRQTYQVITLNNLTDSLSKKNEGVGCDIKYFCAVTEAFLPSENYMRHYYRGQRGSTTEVYEFYDLLEA
jgi:hypothetical protein